MVVVERKGKGASWYVVNIHQTSESHLYLFFFQHGKRTKKKDKKTEKGIVIDLSEILISYSTTAVVSSYTT